MLMAGEERNCLDLVGTPCPMNFVRIVIALEQLPPGAVVEARVDGGPLAVDVQHSLTSQGYEVLALEEREDATLLKVRKKIKK